GKLNRMRDAEVADLYGDGKPAMAVATHDKGVVAVLRPKDDGTMEAVEIDKGTVGKEERVFVHEIEIGDVDGDKTLEVYSTPSEPNRLDGSIQTGRVMRYVPKKGGAPEVAADLGDRHAKEILVTDMDGDGKDELYVAVEAKTKKEGKRTVIVEPVEIRRYTATTDPKKGDVVATLQDRLCRFLSAGDIDGDGKREMVVAPFKSGLYLFRPTPSGTWKELLVDKKSSGFEHAAILLDLDGDKKDEIYVASDNQGELRRYTWNGAGFDQEVILKRDDPRGFITWNLMPVPVEMLQ
ncbi:MAG: VCBS repeat-containing protein, partial [Myxococcota bacterium]